MLVRPEAGGDRRDASAGILDRRGGVEEGAPLYVGEQSLARDCGDRIECQVRIVEASRKRLELLSELAEAVGGGPMGLLQKDPDRRRHRVPALHRRRAQSTVAHDGNLAGVAVEDDAFDQIPAPDLVPDTERERSDPADQEGQSEFRQKPTGHERESERDRSKREVLPRPDPEGAELIRCSLHIAGDHALNVDPEPDDRIGADPNGARGFPLTRLDQLQEASSPANLALLPS